jgi:hypothetical protein
VKYFETKHEKNSARVTIIIIALILLFLFIMGLPYRDPPEEYGIAVNFGTTDFGSGNEPLSKPKEADVSKQAEASKPQQEKTEPTQATAKTEDVLTAENSEEIAIKKQKLAETKDQVEVERVERLKREAEEEKERVEAEKKKKLDNLIGGVKNAKGNGDGGEGPDNKAGNKGQLEGNPYAPSYFGGSGPGKGGVGYGLAGRGRPSKIIYKQDCNEYGLVIVQIEVNRIGQVVRSTPGAKGTTNTHPCLLAPAKKIAESHKWPADSNAPATQVGFVSINFDVSQ